MKKLKQILCHSLLCMVAIALFQMVWDAHLAAQDAVTTQIKNESGSQEPFVPEKKIPGFIVSKLNLSFHFSDGEERQWLRIENHDPRTKDFHPSLTNIVCDYKPIVRKLGPNKYEITFTSEIAEDLP